jgi:decaprenyl-phosphate phosphoribosyltransferase
LKYLKLIRVKQWAKNAFLFIPIFFAAEIFDLDKQVLLLAGFFCFSFVASAIYILNDYRDVEVDRMHPKKKFRPLASGAVSKSQAIGIFALLLIAGFTGAFLLNHKFCFVLGLYFLLNIGYCFGLKHISILDVLMVSVGFVLRVKAGGILTNIAVSEWLMLLVFLLALFLALAKRRDDVLLKIESGKDLRQASKGYNLDFLNVSVSIVCAVILVVYLMYCMDPKTMERFDTYRLYYTTIFVLAGILRYLQLAYVKNDTGSPTQILYKDRFIQLSIVGWVLSFYFIIYVLPVILPGNSSWFN